MEASTTEPTETRAELVWPGKRDAATTTVGLPFQIIERVNETRGAREAKQEQGLTLFDVWKGDEGDTYADGWRNKLIWGDNRLVIASLLDQLAGKVKFIYIDPPFATGTDFSIQTEISESGTTVYKEQSIVEEKAYRDTLGARRRLLSPDDVRAVAVDA